MHKWKQIIALVSALVALGALATWDEWQTKKDEKAKESKGLLITDVKPDDIVAVHFISRGDSEVGGDKAPAKEATTPKGDSKPVDIDLSRTDSGWKISRPITTDADAQSVSDLLKNILEYKSENEVASGKDKWADFGLDNPRRSIELKTTSGRNILFLVGNNTPVGFGTYVATGISDKIYSGSQYIATATLKTLFDLRDKKVLKLMPHEVKSVTITSSTEKTALEKADNSWSLLTPTKVGADLAAVNNLLDDLASLKAAEFIDQPDAQLSKASKSGKNLAKIEVRAGSQNIALRLFEFSSSIYADVDGQLPLLKLGNEAKEKLVKSSKSLRDKKIFSFQSAEISSVTVDGLSYKKVANDWYSETDASKIGEDGKFSGKPEDKPATAGHIRGLIVDLEYARAEDVVDNAASLKLPKAPKHQVVLGPIAGPDKIQIDAWQGTGTDSEALWLKTSGSEKIYKVKKTVLASILPQASKPPVGDEASAPIPTPAPAATNQ